MRPDRLLIINFEMDLGSPVLAWQPKVVSGMAKRYQRVDVLTHRIGEIHPEPNCGIHRFPLLPQRRLIRSLGGIRLLNLWASWILRKAIPQACFIHMNMSWAYQLRPFFRRHRIPALMWYAHGSVTPELHRALEAVDRVVTSTPEGFRIPSPKVCIIGQAIDTDLFSPPEVSPHRNDVVYVGRIAERKRIDAVIDCFAELIRLDSTTPFRLQLIGPVLTEADRGYMAAMQAKVESLGLSSRVCFTGPLKPAQIPPRYSTAFAHLNLSETGSMDKTVMESLACGCPVLTTGIAFRQALGSIPGLLLTNADPGDVAQRLIDIHRNPYRWSAQELRSLVVGKHDLSHYLDQLEHHLTEIGSVRP